MLRRSVRSVRLGTLGAILCAVAASVAIAATAPGWPALVEPPSQEHHIGKVIFVELVTNDLAGAEQFYGALLGWKFRDMQAGASTYAEASLNGELVGGLYHRPFRIGQQQQPAWLGFMSVRDVDASMKLALSQGAKILSRPHDVPGHGREAVFVDPQGATFAVMASSSGDPADEQADPGEWIWSSLFSTDIDAGAGFYQSLFDYEIFDLAEPGGAQHLIFSSDNFARASANEIPATWSRKRPHWLQYVRVEDAVATAARVVSLGGHVLLEPRDDRHGGKVAVVTDPQGAEFGLLEWPEARSQKGTP